MVDTIDAQIAAADLKGVVYRGGETDDVRPWLLAADISVVPSTKPDPLPTTVLESMSAGLPVVGTRHGGCLDMIDDGRTGLLVGWEDPAELAEALAELLRDEAMRAKLGTAAVKEIHARFSYGAYATAWQRLVDSHTASSKR
jgi:glycosyltransferase involved in cell wall biosynthesis